MENLVNELLDTIREQGIKSLLPQNMSDHLLERITEEFNSIKDGTGDKPGSCILLSVLQIEAYLRGLSFENFNFELAEEEIWNKMITFGLKAYLELMIRQGYGKMGEGEEHTLENILTDNSIQ